MTTACGWPGTMSPSSSRSSPSTLTRVSSSTTPLRRVTCRASPHRTPRRSEALRQPFRGAGDEPDRDQRTQERCHQHRGPLDGHGALAALQDRGGVDGEPVRPPSRPGRGQWWSCRSSRSADGAEGQPEPPKCRVVVRETTSGSPSVFTRLEVVVDRRPRATWTAGPPDHPPRAPTSGQTPLASRNPATIPTMKITTITFDALLMDSRNLIVATPRICFRREVFSREHRDSTRTRCLFLIRHLACWRQTNATCPAGSPQYAADGCR
jgi:hypothetical protein